MVVASFGFITDVLSARDCEISADQKTNNSVLVRTIVAFTVQGDAGFLYIVGWGIISVQSKGIHKRNDNDLFIGSRIREHACFERDAESFKRFIKVCKDAHNLPISSSSFCFIAASQADFELDFAGFKKGFAG